MSVPTIDKLPLELESEILTRYLINEKPNELAKELYVRIVQQPRSKKISDKDLAVLNFAFAYPFLLPALDSVLALVQPNAELRRRAYIMFSILETVPEYSDKFLSDNHSYLYIVLVIFVGLRSALRIVLGTIMLGLIRA